MHERLAAEYAEERVAHLLRFADCAAHRRQVDRLLLRRHIDPAPLAAEVAAIDDRDVKKRREKLAALEAGLVLLDRAMPLKPKFQASFHSSRLSVSSSTRLAMRKYIVVSRPWSVVSCESVAGMRMRKSDRGPDYSSARRRSTLAEGQLRLQVGLPWYAFDSSGTLYYRDFERLSAARETAREDLLFERTADGHWVGELASSALATATAVSALALFQSSRIKVQSLSELGDLEPETWNLEPLIERGIDYLATQQNANGGFGDTDLSHSNIATTMLVRAAFHLCGTAADTRHHGLLARATGYIEANGGIGGLRARYGKDKTFAVPILTNCGTGRTRWLARGESAALRVGRVSTKLVPLLSVAGSELCDTGARGNWPGSILSFAAAKLDCARIRRASISRTLKVLEQMQPESGGYLEAIPLTSFVVMSLAGTGRANHLVARRGVKFLLDTARTDGSWPIDTNLATWVTTLAMNAIKGSGFRGQGSGSGQDLAVKSEESGGRQENIDKRGLDKAARNSDQGIPGTEFGRPSTKHEVRTDRLSNTASPRPGTDPAANGTRSRPCRTTPLSNGYCPANTSSGIPSLAQAPAAGDGAT